MKSLHKLIQNLSQTEKRYVKLRLKSNKSDSALSSYFDKLSKQKEYDILQLQGDSEKSVKLLRSNLGKLFNSILKHLRIYHVDNSPEYAMQGMLSDVSLLKDKGMVTEALKLNKKLIGYAEEREAFHVLKKAYAEQWILQQHSGNLSEDKTLEIEFLMRDCRNKETELEDLSSIYRNCVTIYYDYFFVSKNKASLEKIRKLNEHPLLADSSRLLSDSSKMAFYEIKAIVSMVLRDLEEHHKIRKGQLLLLFGSKVFEDDSTNKVLVTSNVFTYLKSQNQIAELKALFNFFESYFKPKVAKTSNGIFIEKFYDVYLQNIMFLLTWVPEKETIDRLMEEIDDVILKQLKINKLLIARTYLSFAELLILNSRFKEAYRYLIEFQDLSRNKKQSKQFIESELLYLVAYWYTDKVDVFESKMNSLTKRLRVHEIQLEPDHDVLLQALKEVYKSDGLSKEKIAEYSEQIKFKKTFKVLIEAINTKSKLGEIRSQLYSDTSVLEDEDFIKNLHTKASV